MAACEGIRERDLCFASGISWHYQSYWFSRIIDCVSAVGGVSTVTFTTIDDHCLNYDPIVVLDSDYCQSIDYLYAMASRTGVTTFTIPLPSAPYLHPGSYAKVGVPIPTAGEVFKFEVFEQKERVTESISNANISTVYGSKVATLESTDPTEFNCRVGQQIAIENNPPILIKAIANVIPADTRRSRYTQEIRLETPAPQTLDEANWVALTTEKEQLRGNLLRSITMTYAQGKLEVVGAALPVGNYLYQITSFYGGYTEIFQKGSLEIHA